MLELVEELPVAEHGEPVLGDDHAVLEGRARREGEARRVVPGLDPHVVLLGVLHDAHELPPRVRVPAAAKVVEDGRALGVAVANLGAAVLRQQVEDEVAVAVVDAPRDDERVRVAPAEAAELDVHLPLLLRVPDAGKLHVRVVHGLALVVGVGVVGWG